MVSVGKLLRSAREEQKRSLAEIADELCITQRYLRAIEEDDLDSLPGAFFYKSFVKQYAKLVGLPMSRIENGVEQVAAGSSETVFASPAVIPGVSSSAQAPSSRFDEWRQRWGLLPKSDTTPLRKQDPLLQDFNRYVSDQRVGFSIASLAVVLLVCSGFYAWWSQAPQATVAQTQEPAVAPAAQPAALPVAHSNDPSQGIVVPAQPGDDGYTHADLNVSATEKTWLSITADGKVIFSGVLEPSQTKSLNAANGARMKVGNAGGLEIRWKGKAIGPIGPRGQVRTVLLKSDDVEILENTPPPAESTL
jgi:cytoskeleton protein RodZ